MKKAMVMFVVFVACAVLLTGTCKEKEVEDRYVLQGQITLENGNILDIDRLWELERQDPDSKTVQIYYDRETHELCWVYVEWCMVSNDRA